MTWRITHPDGRAVATAPTELEAWLKSAWLDGCTFPWEVLAEWVETAKDVGYRAEQTQEAR